MAWLYGGAFPTWLAPVQVLVISVSERFRGYAKDIVGRLRRNYVRAEFAQSSETISRHVRDAVDRKIPNVLVVGGREQQARSVTLRRYGAEEQLGYTLDEFERRLLRTIKTRSATFLATDQS